MSLNSRATAVALTSVLWLGSHLAPAAAQSQCAGFTSELPSSCIAKYARYYLPYAIQALAAYRPIAELDDKLGKVDPDGYGADVNYTIQSTIQAPDQNLKTNARESFKNWRYQFGSDSYLTCIDQTDNDCQAAYRARWFGFGAGPAFQVWARTRSGRDERVPCTEVAIAIRGTTGSQWDWYSNIDRFGSPADDYYHQLRRNVDGIIKKIQNLDCYKRAASKPQIVSTGHSLGAGLAQLLALANKTGGPRITKVFAFDPSPVTGASLVEKGLRGANAQGLTIDRIYQEGEALSYPRDVAQQYPPAGSRCDPLVRTVKVDVARGSALQLHGMSLITTNLVDFSYDDNRPITYRTPSSPVNCDLRYRAPSGDPDGPLVASGMGRQTLLAYARTGRAGEGRIARALLPDAANAGRAAKRDVVLAGHRADSARLQTAAFTPLQRAE
jgi:pimeloyl-ACP methyl ester carboxylesterase